MGLRLHSLSNGCRYLCDEALDTEALREALSQRVDGAEEVKKEMREDMAEDKRKLKVPQLFCVPDDCYLELLLCLQPCPCKAMPVCPWCISLSNMCSSGHGHACNILLANDGVSHYRFASSKHVTLIRTGGA